VWLASFKQPSAVHGGVGKSATSVGLRAPAGRFDAAKGGSLDTGDGRLAVSSSPGRGPWTAGGSGEMPGDAFWGVFFFSRPPQRGIGSKQQSFSSGVGGSVSSLGHGTPHVMSVAELFLTLSLM